MLFMNRTFYKLKSCNTGRVPRGPFSHVQLSNKYHLLSEVAADAGFNGKPVSRLSGSIENYKVNSMQGNDVFNCNIEVYVTSL